MAVYMSIEDPTSDVIYGLLQGSAFINRVTKEKGKRWALHLYPTEKGRRQGMIYQKRNYGGDLLTFEIKVIDLFNKAELMAVIPREINVDETAIQYLGQ